MTKLNWRFWDKLFYFENVRGSFFSFRRKKGTEEVYYGTNQKNVSAVRNRIILLGHLCLAMSVFLGIFSTSVYSEDRSDFSKTPRSEFFGDKSAPQDNPNPSPSTVKNKTNFDPAQNNPLTSQNWIKRQILVFRTYPHLDRAYRLMDSNRLAEARQELEKYIKIFPENNVVQISYLMLLYQLKDYDQVLKQADILLESQPNLIKALIYRGFAFQNLNQFDEARKSFRSVLQVEKVTREDRLLAFNTIIDMDVKEKKYQDAQDILLEMGRFVQDYNFYFRSGIVAEQKRANVEAEQDYQKALQNAVTAEEQKNILLTLGEFYKKKEDWGKSKPYFESALNLESQHSPYILQSLAYLTDMQKDYNQSIFWMKELLSIQPSVEHREFLANVLGSAGKLEEAIQEYSRILPLMNSPIEQSRILMSRGYFYTQLREYKLATKDFAAAVKMDGTRDALIAYAQSLENMENLSEAVNVLNAVFMKFPSTDVYLRLGVVYSKMHDYENALMYIDRIDKDNIMEDEKLRMYKLQGGIYYAQGLFGDAQGVLDAALQLDPNDHEIYAQLGNVCIKLSMYAEAIDYFEKSIALQDSPDLLQQLAYAQFENGNLDEAIQTNDRLLANPSLSSVTQGKIHSMQANLYTQLGNDAQAVLELRSAIQQGMDHRDTHERLGVSLWKLGQWNEALKEFRLLIGQYKDPILSLYMSRCYVKLEKIDVAIYYLKEAQSKAYLLKPSEKLDVYRELGALYADKKDYSLAENSWSRYLELGYSADIALMLGRIQLYMGNYSKAQRTLETIIEKDPKELKAYQELAYVYAEQNNYRRASQVLKQFLDSQYDSEMALFLGRMYRITGKYAEARQILENINIEELSSDLNVLRFDELAKIYYKEKRFDIAAEMQAKANALQSSPERQYQLGLYNQKLGLLENAIANFENALSSDPQNAEYAKELGYTYMNMKRYDKALEILGNVAENNPHSSDFYTNLGYLYMKHSRDQEAIKWFNKAINKKLSYPLDNDQEKDVINRDVSQLRREISKLENRFDFLLYQVYRSNSDNRPAPGGFGTGGSILAQGGLDIAYQPPVIGFRDERIFQITSKLLWSTKPDSLDIESDSYQGSLGFRYKPMRLQNLFLGAEKLIQIGDQSKNDWLLRGAYSWGLGTDLNDNKYPRNYTSFYVDSGYFLNRPVLQTYYTEARQGIRFNYKKNLIITPHLAVSGRWEIPDPVKVSYSDGGAGILFDYLFNENYKEREGVDLELLIQYKIPFDDYSSGVMVSGAIRQ